MPFTYDSQIFKIPDNFKCLCTLIKNVSSVPKFFLVPFHGTTIGPNEQYAFVGSLLDWLQRKRYRTRSGLLNSIEAGANQAFKLVQLPNVHLLDTASATKMLAIDAMGNVVTATPCWDT